MPQPRARRTEWETLMSRRPPRTRASTSSRATLGPHLQHVVGDQLPRCASYADKRKNQFFGDLLEHRAVLGTSAVHRICRLVELLTTGAVLALRTPWW